MDTPTTFFSNILENTRTMDQSEKNADNTDAEFVENDENVVHEENMDDNVEGDGGECVEIEENIECAVDDNDHNRIDGGYNVLGNVYIVFCFAINYVCWHEILRFCFFFHMA